MLQATIGSLRGKKGSAERSSGPKHVSWLQRQVVPYLQAASRSACTHPIRTLVLVALVASTTYMGLLEGPLFEPPATTDTPTGPVEFGSLLAGSKTLHIGPDTAWKWQNGEHAAGVSRDKVSAMAALFSRSTT